MKIIYVVTCGLSNKYAFAAREKAEEFASQVEGIVDIVPYDGTIGYSELGEHREDSC